MWPGNSGFITQHVFLLGLNLDSPVIHTLIHTPGTNFSRDFFLAVWHLPSHEHSVKILILTYRQVISMKHRALEEGDSVLTALDRLILSRVVLTFSCCSRLSVSISYICPTVHSICPSTFADRQIHKPAWQRSAHSSSLLF